MSRPAPIYSALWQRRAGQQERCRHLWLRLQRAAAGSNQAEAGHRDCRGAIGRQLPEVIAGMEPSTDHSPPRGSASRWAVADSHTAECLRDGRSGVYPPPCWPAGVAAQPVPGRPRGGRNAPSPLAERLGSVNAAASELSTTWLSLRKGFQRHGLGMPARNPEAVCQRAIQAAYQRGGRPAPPALDRSSWRSTPVPSRPGTAGGRTVCVGPPPAALGWGGRQG
jgi:hypothetical protein